MNTNQTRKQTDRQSARRRDGKYADMNRCDFCNKALGEDYQSINGIPGEGLVCCDACAAKHG